MDVVNVTCPQCGTAYRVKGSVTPGKSIRCRKCGNEFLVQGSAHTLPAGATAPSSSRPAMVMASSASSAKDDLLGRVIGGCRIEKKLGQGGMGAVYLAHHEALDIPVAVKILPPQFASANKTAVERFIREARAAARLKHHNIVGVLNVGQEGDLNYIIMDFVEGRSLQDILEEQGTLGVAETLDIISQACQALGVAYDNNIIHRDIKPDNIMIDVKGVVKLADLGLAKSVEEEAHMTQSGMAMGTPHYMSPEQATDARTADHRSDLYSLGCTMYRMLCGNVPYDDQSVYKIMTRHIEDPVPDPKLANASLPDAVAQIIRVAMAKKPEHRYQTAAAMLQDLQNVKQGAAVAATQLIKKSMPGIAASAVRKLAAAPSGQATRKKSQRSRPTRKRTAVKKPVGLTDSLKVWIGGGVAIVLVLGIAIGSYMGKGDEPLPVAPPPDSSRHMQPEPSTMETHSSVVPREEVDEPLPQAVVEHVPPREPPVPEPKREPQPEPKHADGVVVNLIDVIDPQQNRLEGIWWKRGGALISDDFQFAKVEIPYIPPEEYDFRVVYERLREPEGMAQIISHGGRQFSWVAGAKRNSLFGFSVVDGKRLTEHPLPNPPRLPEREKIESIVKVRKEGVAVIVNGELVAECPTDFKNVELPEIFHLGNPDFLGLVTLRSPTRFHVVEVKEITGRGEIVKNHRSHDVFENDAWDEPGRPNKRFSSKQKEAFERQSAKKHELRHPRFQPSDRRKPFVERQAAPEEHTEEF